MRGGSLQKAQIQIKLPIPRSISSQSRNSQILHNNSTDDHSKVKNTEKKVKLLNPFIPNYSYT